MTIVTQFLNRHEDINIFDEIDLLEVHRSGASVVGTLAAFLLERGAYHDFQQCAHATANPARALRTVLSQLAAPCAIWGEKNPRYSMRLDALRRSFPGAAVLFVLRDPREVVNSLLLHRTSTARSSVDFWIKDTVTEALELLTECLQPLSAKDAGVAVLRYEAFAARPAAALDAALAPWGLKFSEDAAEWAHGAPETVGDSQFFRAGAPLPWKTGNMVPLRRTPSPRDRIDAGDPSWSQVDALARRFGYH
ncbi:hypothetical protein A5647_11380 [Mycobacterium sp. 1100029.7]|nr:hypothetical protein A5647_11380 [Mycobacterium sp. 1100029.7]